MNLGNAYILHLRILFCTFKYFFFEKGSINLTNSHKEPMTQKRLRTPDIWKTLISKRETHSSCHHPIASHST